MGFALERNRPPPRRADGAGSPPGLARKGTPPESPSSTRQVNLDGPAKGATLGGLGRGGGQFVGEAKPDPGRAASGAGGMHSQTQGSWENGVRGGEEARSSSGCSSSDSCLSACWRASFAG